MRSVPLAYRARLVRAGLVAVPGLVAVAWLGGFAWFLHATATLPPSPARADGIVALTGGADRVETALRLLAEGRADVLLVSGVGGPTEFGELARRAGIDVALGARVTLGRAASSTHGNASETAEWVRANNVGSLLVVTAAYHMPRALTELGRALPGVRLYPVPVTPTSMRAGIPLRLLAGEYTKFLAATLRLTDLAGLGTRHAAGAAGPVRIAMERGASL